MVPSLAMRELKARPSFGRRCWLVLFAHSGLCSEFLDARQCARHFFFVTDTENLSIDKGGPENEGRGANENQAEAFTSSAET